MMGSHFRRWLGLLVLIHTTSCARLVCEKVVWLKPDHSPTACYGHARWPSTMQTHAPLWTSTMQRVRSSSEPPQRTGLLWLVHSTITLGTRTYRHFLLYDVTLTSLLCPNIKSTTFWPKVDKMGCLERDDCAVTHSFQELSSSVVSWMQSL